MISFLKTGQNTAVLYRGLIESHQFHKIRLLIACFSRLFYKQKRWLVRHRRKCQTVFVEMCTKATRCTYHGWSIHFNVYIKFCCFPAHIPTWYTNQNSSVWVWEFQHAPHSWISHLVPLSLLATLFSGWKHWFPPSFEINRLTWIPGSLV